MLQEYGLPSSHTMNSLCLNFYAVHYLHEHELVGDAAAGERGEGVMQVHGCPLL